MSGMGRRGPREGVRSRRAGTGDFRGPLRLQDPRGGSHLPRSGSSDPPRTPIPRVEGDGVPTPRLGRPRGRDQRPVGQPYPRVQGPTPRPSPGRETSVGRGVQDSSGAVDPG